VAVQIGRIKALARPSPVCPSLPFGLPKGVDSQNWPESISQGGLSGVSVFSSKGQRSMLLLLP